MGKKVLKTNFITPVTSAWLSSMEKTGSHFMYIENMLISE